MPWELELVSCNDCRIVSSIVVCSGCPSFDSNACCDDEALAGLVAFECSELCELDCRDGEEIITTVSQTYSQEDIIISEADFPTPTQVLSLALTLSLTLNHLVVRSRATCDVKRARKPK